MTDRRDWRSGLESVLGLRKRSASEPASMPAAPRARASMLPRASREGPDLLLMRIEALRLHPTRVKASMPTEFRALAHICDYCQDKVRCERDLVYEAAGKTVDWERYCPNAFRLREMGLLGLSGESADPFAR
jgi:hypothetical protein